MYKILMPKNCLNMTVVKPGFGPWISEWNDIISRQIVSAMISIEMNEILTINKFVRGQLFWLNPQIFAWLSLRENFTIFSIFFVKEMKARYLDLTVFANLHQLTDLYEIILENIKIEMKNAKIDVDRAKIKREKWTLKIIANVNC